MPLRDWQFYVVTLAAVLAVFALFRTIVPRRGQRNEHKVDLTIEGRHRRR